MKPINTLLFTSFTAMSLFVSCASKKHYTNPDNYPDAHISFGNGGGISGFVTTYTLLDNGQLLKKMPTQDSFILVQNLDKRVTKQIFNSYQSLALNDIKHNQPGNMYQFMKFHDKNKDNSLTWSNATLPAEYEKLKSFYGLLSSIAKKSEKEKQQ